jgi:hypothetical protein
LRRRAVITVLILAAAGMVVIFGSGVLETEVTFRQEVNEIVTGIADGRAEQVYDAASPVFHQTTLRRRFLSLADQVRSTLGRFRGLGRVEVAERASTGSGKTARVVAAMKFEHGDTTGEVSLLHDGKSWRLLGLSIAIPASQRDRAAELRSDQGQVRAPDEAIDLLGEILQAMRDGKAGEVHDHASDPFKESISRQRFDELAHGQERELGKFVKILAIVDSAQNSAKSRVRIDALLEFERAKTTGTFELVKTPARARRVGRGRAPEAADAGAAAAETGWRLSLFKIVMPEPVAPPDR